MRTGNPPVSGLFRGRRAGDPLFRAGLGRPGPVSGRSGPVFRKNRGFFEKTGFRTGFGGVAGGAGKLEKSVIFSSFRAGFRGHPPCFRGGAPAIAHTSWRREGNGGKLAPWSRFFHVFSNIPPDPRKIRWGFRGGVGGAQFSDGKVRQISTEKCMLF